MKKGIIKSKHKIAPIIGSRTRTGMIYTLCMIYTLFTFVGTNYQDWQPVHSVSTNLVHFFFLITHFPLHIPCRNLSYLCFIPNPLIPLCHPKTFHTSVSSQNLSYLCFVPKPFIPLFRPKTFHASVSSQNLGAGRGEMSAIHSWHLLSSLSLNLVQWLQLFVTWHTFSLSLSLSWHAGLSSFPQMSAAVKCFHSVMTPLTLLFTWTWCGGSISFRHT